MRIFIASSFEPRFIEILADISSYARANAGRDAIKCVERADFHLTYSFLGELPGNGAAAVINSVDAALEGRRAFTVSSGALGAFPFSRNPRVLWLGFGEGVQALREIAGKLASELSERGLAFENNFEPHVTLGRVKRPLPEFFFRRVADYAITKKAVSVMGSVEVMESSLTAEGPVYREIYSKQFL